MTLKIDRFTENPADCSGAVAKIENFIRSSSMALSEATMQQALLGNVAVQIPAHWNNGCPQDLVTRRIPEKATDVMVRANLTSTGTVQFEPCGMKGKRVDLDLDVLLQGSDDGVKGFVSELTKYLFGVFDEHGYEGSEQFPPYYRTVQGLVEPNSCTNFELSGNFGESCLENPNDVNCTLNPEQNQVVSSLLYSADPIVFPQVSRGFWKSTFTQA